MELMHAKIEEELSLHEMAQCAGVSTAHFCEAFRKSTGESPHQFLLRQRVERAKRFVRRGPQGERLQPRARIPALERLSHTRWRQVVDHGIGPFCDHALVARRVLTEMIPRKREEHVERNDSR